MKASLTRCFSKFTTAAIVVGVGLLLFAAPLEAKVVYTSANIQVGPGSNSYQLDANNDGIANFTIYNFLSRSTGCQKDAPENFFDHLEVYPASGSYVVLDAPWAAALSHGSAIGPGQSFGSSGTNMATVRWTFQERIGGDCELFREIAGPWVNVTNLYLGLKFQINGETHYGWAQLSVQASFEYVAARLVGYAYETTPGKAIAAGDQTGE